MLPHILRLSMMTMSLSVNRCPRLLLLPKRLNRPPEFCGLGCFHTRRRRFHRASPSLLVQCPREVTINIEGLIDRKQSTGYVRLSCTFTRCTFTCCTLLFCAYLHFLYHALIFCTLHLLYLHLVPYICCTFICLEYGARSALLAPQGMDCRCYKAHYNKNCLV